MKKFLGTAALIAILGALIFFSFRSRQTVYNDETTIGNSSSNLFNGGLFCEYEDQIYFSNPADQGRLYVMDGDLSSFKKLSTDTATHINVAGKYIIYGRHNQNQIKENENVFEMSKTGLYRMDKDGKNLKTLFDAAVNVVSLYGNTVYFQRNTKSGFGISQIKIDKSDETLVSEEPISPYVFIDQNMYYVGVSKDHNIYQMSLSSHAPEVWMSGNFAYLTNAGSTLYYLDLNRDHALCSVNLTDKEPTVLVEMPTSTYNITPDGSYLYYQVDNGTNNGIYRMDLETRAVTCLKSGNFSNIHTTTRYTFFKEFDQESYYVVENSKDSQPVAFTPTK